MSQTIRESLDAPLIIFRNSGACYIRTEPPISTDLTNTVFAGFQQLVSAIESGEANYNDWCIDEHGTGDPDLGLIERRGEHKAGEGRYDHKFFFHWSPQLSRHLPATCRNTYRNWLWHCETLFHSCRTNVNRFAGAMDPELGAQMSTDAAVMLSKLRLLMYVQEREGKVASNHTDRATITMHVAETAPGIVLGHQQAPEVAPEGKKLIFAGDKLQRFTSGAIKAIPHHAVNHSQPGVRRMAIVYFGHSVEVI